MAELYLAREEVLARTSAAPAAVQQALVKALASSEKEVAVIAEQVRWLFEKRAAEGVSKRG